MSAILRRAAVLLVTVGLLTVGWRPCAGWEATPEARMSCCLRKAACAMHKVADGGAAKAVSQADADTCCAASDRQEPVPTSIAVVVAPPVVPVLAWFAAPPAVPVSTIDRHRPPPLLADRALPRHLLLSVFLI